MINELLRHMVDTIGLKRLLSDLADICDQSAEEDLTFRPDWTRAADRLNKMVDKTHERL